MMFNQIPQKSVHYQRQHAFGEPVGFDNVQTNSSPLNRFQQPSVNTRTPHVPGQGYTDGLGCSNNEENGFVMRNGLNSQNGMVTMQNIMSRQVIDKKLPYFGGNPLEWNSWYNRYSSTTAKCNLDNSENLDRLEKFLKGKARDMVQSKLGQTEAVPWIISTLKKLYGRPEVVLKAHLQKIKELPPIKNENLKSLMEFAFEAQSVRTAIESSGSLVQFQDPTLLEELVEKLPPQVKLDWAKFRRGRVGVTVKTFIEWLEDLADALSTIVEPTVEKCSKGTDKRKDSGRGMTHVNVHLDGNSQVTNDDKAKRSKCLTCGKEGHKLENCSKFKDLSVDERWEEIKNHKICRSCLKKHKFPCKSTNVCGKTGCTYKHHNLLHNSNRHSPKNTALAGNNVHHDDSNIVLLKYAPVILHKGSRSVKTIAFFDDGSQTSMLEQRLAEELKVSGTKEQLCLLWTDHIHRKENAQRVSIEISSESNPECKYPLDGIRSIQSLHLPPQTFRKEDFIKSFPHLKGVPACDYNNAVPGILIGTDFPKLGVQQRSIEGKDFRGPVASKTRLGWVVYGPGSTKSPDRSHMNVHRVVQMCPSHNQSDQDLHQQVKEYFSIENFGVRANEKSTMETKENERALELLKKFTKKIDGGYETGLLWKHDTAGRNMPDRYPNALRRLISLEKQGEKVVKSIGEKINEYVNKGYAKKLSPDEVKKLGDNVWYLPVFGVFNPKKEGKMRMVFDAAAKVKSVSLNSMLLTGPDELSSLVDILRRLREKLFAVGGDIREMFHQIKIREIDQKYQMFLFRNDASQQPDVYVMSAMTFGSKCSPAAAQFIKNTNARQFQKTHPRAVESIVDNHYVDDMLDGENSIDAAIQILKDVKMIHAVGGFEIRNFISNSPEVLKAIGVSDNGEDKEICFDSELKTEKILGMWWNTNLDCFTFSLKYTFIAKEILEGKKMPTKRELLRTLMSIFDPLGLLSNFLIQLKILLQDVWRAELNWDEQISESGLVSKWKQWLEYLPMVENVQVPRLYSMKLTSDKPNTLEIHTFVDASVDAFAAVIYLRVSNEDGVDCSLIGSKARVAPLKYLSIPRKELQAAVLGTRLMTSVCAAQRLKINRRIFWSDSETVLSWLKSDHKKYSPFVAHRVGEVLENSEVNEWRWIPTKENVADEATKWSKSINFESTNRWFGGPSFLRLSEDQWPKKKVIKSDVEEEMKAHCMHTRLMAPQLVNPERFSKWNRMVRTVAYLFRFRNVFGEPKRKGTSLDQDELTKAEDHLFRQAQFEGYPSEMVILLHNKSLPVDKQKRIEKPSPLFDGTPYLDADGILRMRGRIDGARDLSLNSKRPIVLPRDSRITRLLVHHYHAKYLHQNHGTVINEI